jgi:hypothetical protein
MALKFSKGNAKLGKQTLIFNLPAGKTCPGASLCKAFAVMGDNGKTRIQDGTETVFRCFAASSEAQYPVTFAARAHNLQKIVEALQVDVNEAAFLINSGIQTNRTKNTELVRIHESGDMFSLAYLQAWIIVAKLNPGLKFYCYSKSLEFFLGLTLPENFYLTASYGGKFDHLIDQGYFTRYSKVVMNDSEAEELGLQVDHDDSHCFGDKPFALLVHGTQPKGSIAAAKLEERKRNGAFSGYNGKQKVAVAIVG